MKISIFNPFIDKFSAETEISKRISIAAQNLGWKIQETSSPNEVNEFNPDFVLMLHFNTPKLFGFPTYGCMWNPPVFFRKYGDAIGQPETPIKNILSYDAYLSSGGEIDSWLNETLQNTRKTYFTAPFYTSCNKRSYTPPDLVNPCLTYIGTNWDGFRFKQLFKNLDFYEFMKVYGPQSGWKFLKKSYKGSLPFDGTSVLDTLNESGVGLCLHKKEHCNSEIPSMRIFEIVSSGAVAICGEHPFIRKNFGDFVLYLEKNLNPKEQCEQISDYINWIGSNSKKALEMSRAAYEVFVNHLSLETLLENILPLHKNLVERKGFVSIQQNNKNPYNEIHSQKRIQFIVRVGGRNLTLIKRSLDSIANQTYQYVSVIIVQYNEVSGLHDLLKKYENRMPIQVITSHATGFRSTQLYDGISNLNSDYFAILDDDDTIHPNHVYTLISHLEENPRIGVVYSGAIRVWESINNSNKSSLVTESLSLAHFESFDIRKIANLNNFISSNSFIARTSCLANISQEDPSFSVAEDLFLILNLAKKELLQFTYEVTCEHYWSESALENISLKDGKPYKNRIWVQEGERLLNLFWKDEFIYNVDNGQNIKSEYTSKKLLEMYSLKTPKISIPLDHNNVRLPISIFNILRFVYLKVTDGGLDNPTPNSFANLLIYVKRSFLNK
jgi:glycosyltransferase involved in cell wall biosynthesis